MPEVPKPDSCELFVFEFNSMNTTICLQAPNYDSVINEK